MIYLTWTGHITHRSRPTYYSPSSRTTLAEAELKYKDDFKSRSIYIGLPVDEADMSPALKKAWRQACNEVGEKDLQLAIWTTTAWSLPGNLVNDLYRRRIGLIFSQGVAVHKDLSYILALPDDGDMLVILEDRLNPLREILGNLRIVARLQGE